jgi:hypothetical protein
LFNGPFHSTDESFIKNAFMFGTNSICNQRPKAGYET